MKTFLAAVLVIVLCLITATPVFADGGFFVPDISKDIYQPAQKAIIHYENNREDLILQVKYEGDADEFAWVIPVPNYPDVNVSEPAMFEELAYFTSVVLPSSGGLEAPSETSLVDVWEEATVGIYNYAILSAEDPQALIDWLNSNGYLFPEDGQEIIDYYIYREWYFVAIKINTGEEATGLAEGTIQPLRLSFDSDEIVYPLKITSLSSDICEVLLYVFADQKVVPEDYQHLSLNSAEQVVYLEREENVFYLESVRWIFSGQSYSGDQIYCGGSASTTYYLYDCLYEFSGLLEGDYYYLTKMRANISADNMIDIKLIRYEEELYLDSDGDGWSDKEEAIARTNPDKIDTDGDEIWDAEDPYPLNPAIDGKQGLPGYAWALISIASLIVILYICRRIVRRKRLSAHKASD